MNVVRSIKKLSLSTKVQLIIAIALTIALAVTIPTYSWFNNERKIAELAKIKSPDNLYINAAHKEDVIHLDMSSIDLTQKVPDTNTSITAQSFAFSVSGEWVNSFTLQIEHTTNNPFTYSFYEGTIYPTKAAMLSAHHDCETRSADGSLPYVEYIVTGDYDDVERTKVKDYPNYPANDVTLTAGQTCYIWYGGNSSNEIKNKANATGGYLNKAENGRYANTNVNITPKSYEGSQTYNQYALPVYWQLQNIGAGVSKGSSFYKTYIVKVSWTGQDMNDYKKETDIFYISAFVS